MDNKNVLEIALKSFSPGASIINFEKIVTGMSESQAFKVEIKDPSQILFVKIFPEKYEDRIKNEEKVINFLNQNNIPTPKLLHVNYDIGDNLGIVINSWVDGKTLDKVFGNAEFETLAINSAAEVLTKIHKLPILPLWQKNKREVNNLDDWIAYTKSRFPIVETVHESGLIDDEKKERLVKSLRLFLKKLENSDMLLCPLHWDYNPQNILINEIGEVEAIFDFESHQVGHNLDELGTIYYWLKVYNKEELFKDFLNIYSKDIAIDQDSKEFIQNYYLLRLFIAIDYFERKAPENVTPPPRLKEMLKEI